MTICVVPRLDVEVMLSMPAIVENCFSSGVATVAAIVCGLVPGNVALTVTVGKSTFGKSLTGNCRYATMPKTRMPIMTNVVMTGRLINRVVKFIDYRSVSLPENCELLLKHGDHRDHRDESTGSLPSGSTNK